MRPRPLFRFRWWLARLLAPRGVVAVQVLEPDAYRHDVRLLGAPGREWGTAWRHVPPGVYDRLMAAPLFEDEAWPPPKEPDTFPGTTWWCSPEELRRFHAGEPITLILRDRQTTQGPTPCPSSSSPSPTPRPPSAPPPGS